MKQVVHLGRRKPAAWGLVGLSQPISDGRHHSSLQAQHARINMLEGVDYSVMAKIVITVFNQ